ncbi:unnamed protein product [Urochloa humidicola]
MALRRLARRAIQRAAPVPAPPPPPVPISPLLRSHILLRFSTFSSDQPHFMVDYLISTCGFPPDKAAKAAAAPRFAHLTSTVRPDAVLAFLRSRGLTHKQVLNVVSWDPKLLLSDVDATLAPKFRAVPSLGLTPAEAARLFALYPSALTMGVHTNLLPRILLWLDLLGSARLLMKFLAKTWLLKHSADALLRNLDALRGYGVPEARLAATVRLKPSLILQSPAKLDALAARVDACGVPRGSGIVRVCAPGTAQRQRRSVPGQEGRRDARDRVHRGEEFLAMFRRAPCFLFLSVEMLRRKVEFLVGTVRCGADYIVRNPVLLTYSLDKRMVPRAGEHRERVGGKVCAEVHTEV